MRKGDIHDDTPESTVLEGKAVPYIDLKPSLSRQRLSCSSRFSRFSPKSNEWSRLIGPWMSHTLWRRPWAPTPEQPCSHPVRLIGNLCKLLRISAAGLHRSHPFHGTCINFTSHEVPVEFRADRQLRGLRIEGKADSFKAQLHQ
jgi:hypothetical protein